MEKFIYYNCLFDIYKELISPQRRKIFELYYEENWSMQEIADSLQVSKSYVGNVLKQITTKLDDYEDKLHIYAHNEKLSALLEINDIEKIKNGLREILK